VQYLNSSHYYFVADAVLILRIVSGVSHDSIEVILSGDAAQSSQSENPVASTSSSCGLARNVAVRTLFMTDLKLFPIATSASICDLVEACDTAVTREPYREVALFCWIWLSGVYCFGFKHLGTPEL